MHPAPLLTRLLLALVLLAPGAAAGAERSAVRAMMETSGMVAQYSQLGELFSAALLQSRPEETGMAAEQLGMLAAISREVVSGPQFLAELETELAESLGPAEIEAVSAFYGTPLGARLREAEIAASGIAAQTEIEAGRAALTAEIKEQPERLAIVRRMDEGLFLSELSATMAAGLAYAFLTGVMHGEPHLLEAMRAQLAADHERVLADMREQLLATFAWTYRGFTDAELADYAAFLESAAARATFAAMFAVSTAFFERSGTRIGEEFAAALRERRT